MTFSSYNRKEIISRLKEESLDLLVIGGGITGSGIALDAATRGLKTGLIEMQDFAAGTSSRSTKLVHGGLRYLQQFEVKMVAEVGKERAIVYENGPHVTTPEWMMLPFHKGSTLGPLTSNIGLRVYDFLAGVKKKERRQIFRASEALEREPLIKEKDLRGAGFYVEYKTDDARLTIEVIKKAAEKGVAAVNYAKAVEYIYNEAGKIQGVVMEDLVTGEKSEIYAKKVVNAGGPWVDELRELDGSKKGKQLYLTKGVHLVFPQERFPLKQAIYFDSQDGRMIFAIPRDNKTYVGTTDTAYKGDIARPRMTVADRDYIIEAINYMFPSLEIKPDDVESSWAGLRPLIAEDGKDNPSEISRKDEIFVSDSGLISMAGGKLTGYRKMAEHAVDLVTKQMKEEIGILYSGSETKHLPISGGDVGGSEGFKSFLKDRVQKGISLGLQKEVASKLVQTYGSNVDKVFDLYSQGQHEADRANIEQVLFAELVYAMEHELAYRPVDFFIRRTGALFFDINRVKKYKEPVIAYMGEKLGWSEKDKKSYSQELEQHIMEAQQPEE